MSTKSEFQPKWACPPGATIAEVLHTRGISVEEFASLIEEGMEYADNLLDGRATITLRVAKRLEQVLGASTQFWMARDAQYRDDAARLRTEGRDWLRALPLGDMIKFRWLETPPRPSDELDACLRFFGVATLPEWHQRYDRLVSAVAFRTSPAFDSSPFAVAAWLRKGELEAESIDCREWDPQSFRASLDDIRKLTLIREPAEFLPQLRELCSASGVALQVVRTPTGCRASGATLFPTPNKPLLLLSFRYLSDDQFWFTFFHEAGHLLLHGNHEVFLEGMQTLDERLEAEANAFAEDVLLPDDLREELLCLPTELRPILRFSRKAGVSAGIVVGQLQHHRRVPRNHFNNLKVRYEWAREQ